MADEDRFRSAVVTHVNDVEIIAERNDGKQIHLGWKQVGAMMMFGRLSFGNPNMDPIR